MHTVANTAKHIGAGAFGAVYVVSSDINVALKVVKDASEAGSEALWEEFNMMAATYAFHRNIEQMFRIPVPYAACHPTKILEMHKAFSTFTDIRLCPDLLDKQFFELNSSNSVYAMQRIPTLPILISGTLLDKITPPPHSVEHTTLCRLYLGRETTTNRSRFFNTRNFPLDQPTYEWLRRNMSTTALPDSATVAREMGRMIATIHSAGFDARDIEFVLAGDEGSSYPRFYTFDFNQMRPLTGSSADRIAFMTESFFLNDPYFPRPRFGAPFYESFKDGYGSVDRSHNGLATDFFLKLEEWQRQIDDRRSVTEAN